MTSVRSTMCCWGAAVDTVGSSSGRFSISAYDRARETSEKIAITSRNWGLRGSVRTTAHVPSSNVTVVNGLPLVLIATSFPGDERHAGRQCASEENKKIPTKTNIYPDSLRIRKKVLAMVGERDLSTRHDSLRVSERC